MSAEAKNLEAISQAIARHGETCEFDLIEILMNPFEVERLGWDKISGIPIRGDESMGTGHFRLVCAKEKEIDSELNAVAIESELVNA